MDRIKLQWSAELDLITGQNPKHAQALLEQIQQDLLDQIRPYKFEESDIDSVIHKREESFIRLCLEMERKNIHNPESMTTLKFYKTVEILKEETDQQIRKNHGRHN